MKILFLDQTGSIGGAEKSMADVARVYRDTSLVGLFEDGPYREYLEERNIPVRVLSKTPITVRRESGLLRSISSVGQFAPLIATVASLSRNYDLIYANTPKALVIGAIASAISRKPLIYHLRDILTPEHFSTANRRILVTIANRFAAQVIAVSQAAQRAFIEAGGRPDIVRVIYNGFDATQFAGTELAGASLRQVLGVDHNFVVGHFSRLSSWKGQHILIQALPHCDDSVVALLVGDALFGEEAYGQYLHELVDKLQLHHRVKFLGFRTDVPQLMAACDLVAHTSTAPEPCSRVLIETMLSGKPLVATRDGGSIELVADGKTGWLVTPADPMELASLINKLQTQPDYRSQVAHQARVEAGDRFDLGKTIPQVEEVMMAALMRQA